MHWHLRRYAHATPVREVAVSAPNGARPNRTDEARAEPLLVGCILPRTR